MTNQFDLFVVGDAQLGRGARYLSRGATFSADRRYRYHLWRQWADNPQRVCFVGLNPSTADESEDDPTIRKCIGFAMRWSYGAIDMVNLFAWRSTDPRGLLEADYPVGPANDREIEAVCARASLVVVCWGTGSPGKLAKLVVRRAAQVVAGPLAGAVIKCLGRCADGSPRHPSRLPYATKLEGWCETPTNGDGGKP